MRLFIASTLILLYNIAAAEPANWYKVKTHFFCSSWHEVEQVINNYGERPLLRAMTNRFNETGNSTIDTIIFSNPEKNSFTIVEQWDEETYCVISAGQYLRPYQYE